MSSTEKPDGTRLLAIARHAIEARLGLADAEPPPTGSPLGASFVTLTRRGELRGCIGSLEAQRPLFEDVATNACNAAFRDPRFPPVVRTEWPGIAVEISVLGDIEWCDCPNLGAALDWVRVGRDGVVIASGARRATFLPQVWETLPAPADFFDHLLRKAGLGGRWPEDARVGRYPVHKFREIAAESFS